MPKCRPFNRAELLFGLSKVIPLGKDNLNDMCGMIVIQVKKAKTHYINFRNPTVNTKERSRTLHRLWFDMLKFPTIRELEESTPSLVHVENSSTGQKCLNCTVTFGSHDGVVDHLESNATCRERYKEEGKTYCVICDKHFENVDRLYSSMLYIIVILAIKSRNTLSKLNQQWQSGTSPSS